MNKIEIDELIEMALTNIKQHLEDIKYKTRVNHKLSNTDLMIMNMDIDLLLKIDRWLNHK